MGRPGRKKGAATKELTAAPVLLLGQFWTSETRRQTLLRWVAVPPVA